MKKLLISMMALAGALLWGCEEPQEVIDYNSQDLKITATIEQTRTSVTSSSVAWAAGDEIKLVCDGEEYAFTTTTAGESAEFTSTAEITPATIEGSAVTAYYGCNSLGAYTIPQNQSVVGGVNQTKVPMYAYTAEAPEKAVLPLTFKPAASVLEVVLGSKAISVESISLSPAAGAMVTGGICGTFNVNALTGKVSAKNTLETLTVTFDQSQNLENNGLSVQIPIGWCTITGGLKLTITYNEGNIYEDVLWADETVSTYAEVDGAQNYKYFVEEVEIDLGPRDWYVKADGNANAKGRNWAKATTLSNALVNAAAGSTIHIAAGTYKPENYILGNEDLVDARKTFEVSRALTLVGGYPADAAEGATADATANATILDGDATAYHVMLVTSTEKVVLKGLTIQNGDNSTAPEPDAKAGTGYVTSAVNEALIEDKSGAGLYVAGVVEMENCVVTSNKGNQGAGVYSKDADLTIKNSTITLNTNAGNGGGVWVWNGTANIDGTTISNNGDVDTNGVGRGLYVYAEAGKSVVATVNNTTISGNLASTQGNQTGLYVRGEDATATATATITNSTIKENDGGMGAGFGTIYATLVMDNCEAVGNAAKNNGTFYFLDGSTVSITNSRFVDNTNTGNGLIYAYNTAEGTDSNIYFANCLLKGNSTGARGGAIYVRANTSPVVMTIVNSTIAGNQNAGFGSAINIYGNTKADAGHATVNLISCTITENFANVSGAKGAAVSQETTNTEVNVYNTIIAGNTANEESTIDPNFFVKDESYIKASVIGEAVYGDNAVVEGKAFATADLGVYAEGVYPVVNTSVAWTDGMAAADLYTLGSGLNADLYTEAVMKADQNGNARNGNVMGAYVGQ